MHNTASSEEAGDRSRTERLRWTVRGRASMWDQKGALLSSHGTAEEACVAGAASTRGDDYVVQRAIVEASAAKPHSIEMMFTESAHRRSLRGAAGTAVLPSGPYGRERCGHVGRCHCRGYAR